MPTFAAFLAFLLLPFLVVAQTPSVPGQTISTDGSYTHADLFSNQTNTGPTNVGISGMVTPGDIVGFDYAFTYQGTPYALQFRHTMAAGDTLKTAVDDLAAQFKSHPTVNAAIGPDIVSYALVRQPSPSAWYFQFFQSWPFIETGHPAVSIYASPGSTAQMNLTPQVTWLEVNPYMAFGRSVISKGRQPQPTDAIGGFYFASDATNTPLDLRNVDPMYGQIVAYIIDPTPGVTTAMLDVSLDTVIHSGKHVTAKDNSLCANPYDTGRNCKIERIYPFAGQNIADWRTIATVKPSTTTSTSLSKVKCDAVANTSGLGVGSLETQWSIVIADAPPVLSPIGADATSGTSPPRLRLVNDPSGVLVQVASTDGAGVIANGFVTCAYFLSDGQGNQETWTLQ